MKVKTYMIAVYAVLVKNGKREIEELPEALSLIHIFPSNILRPRQFGPYLSWAQDI